jgi:hypothetical protein
VQVGAKVLGVVAQGVFIYVTYYGFCGFWFVLLNPYKGP